LVVAVLRALETCATIDEAVAQLAAQTVFVSESVVIASGRAAPGQPVAVCLELAPGRHHVRSIVDGRLVVTNHFEHPDWAADAANRARRRDGTTTARNARLHELVLATPKHTPLTVATTLRDRRGEGGRDLGFGHRSSINSWIGAHLVVADLTAGVLWVAEPQHGLGRMWAFDANGPRPDLEPLPPSDDLASFAAGGATWSERLSVARRLVVARAPTAAAACRELIAANPQHYEPYALLAAVTEARDPAETARLLREALARQPAYAAEQRDLAARLARLVERGF
jgi:hypothetical protein